MIPLSDAAFSAGRVAVLLGALWNGRFDLLREAMRDRLHTPYRAPLIPGYDAVEEAALTAGASAVFISGSGPTVGAVVEGENGTRARDIADRMVEAFQKMGLQATPLVPVMDRGGTRVERMGSH